MRENSEVVIKFTQNYVKLGVSWGTRIPWSSRRSSTLECRLVFLRWCCWVQSIGCSYTYIMYKTLWRHTHHTIICIYIYKKGGSSKLNFFMSLHFSLHSPKSFRRSVDETNSMDEAPYIGCLRENWVSRISRMTHCLINLHHHLLVLQYLYYYSTSHLRGGRHG